MKYDVLIVGAGIYGATFARMLTTEGKRVKVIDKRSHIAGNCYDKKVGNTLVHKYGAHIFHTDNEEVWRFVNEFTTFTDYVHKVKTECKGKRYTLPFNLTTIEEVYGKDLIDETVKWIELNKDRQFSSIENKGRVLLGDKMFEMLVKGYTEKQWSKPCSELPASILSRLPVRLDRNDNYFSDKHQGMPEWGYTDMIINMLHGIDVELGVEFDKQMLKEAKLVLYCGSIDELLDYEYGYLPYRSLEFKEYTCPREEEEKIPVLNFADKSIPATRIINHRLFYSHSFDNGDTTIETLEYPCVYREGKERYYPINTDVNNELYDIYLSKLMVTYPTIIPGGRLGKYRYFDMDDAIFDAMSEARRVALCL